MKKYKCLDCGCTFKQPHKVHTTYESYHGVSSEFMNHHPMTYDVCPNCKRQNIETVYYSNEEDEEDEYE